MSILVLAILVDDYRLDKLETIIHRVSFSITSFFAIFSGIYWYSSVGSSFNFSVFDILWELLALLTVSFYMGLLILNHKRSSGIAMILFVILFIGIISHFVFSTNDFYSGPLRLSQFVVLATVPAILRQHPKIEKAEFSIQSEISVSKEDKNLIITTKQDKLSEAELAFIWMEFAGIYNQVDHLPKFLRAISLSFHQDFVLFSSLPDESNQISILAGFNSLEDEFVSSGKILLPKNENLVFTDGKTDPVFISKNKSNFHSLFEQLYEFLKIEDFEEIVIAPLENNHQYYGLLLFISPENKKRDDNYSSEYFYRISDMASKTIFSIFEPESDKTNQLKRSIITDSTDRENPSIKEIMPKEIEKAGIIMEQSIKSPNLNGAKAKELITMIVQELRQPLSSILGYTDLMLSESSGVIGPLQQKFLEKIKVSNERMRNLLEELIRITSIGESQSNLNFETLNFDELIGIAIDNNQNLIMEKHIILRLNFDPGVPELTLDRQSIQQVMNNMINYAVFRSIDGGKLNVEINLKESDMDEKYLLTIIENSGEEYQEDQFKNVSSEEYKLESAATKWVSNFGLNLAITKNLIEAMGGRIWIEPIIGLGNRYSFLLPIQNFVSHKRIYSN